MEISSETARRILRAFLDLAAERGIAATTTSLLAKTAGVNEVTIFRLFKNKEGLVRAVYQHGTLEPRIAAYFQALALDVSHPERAIAELVACLTFLYECFSEHPQLWLLGMSDYWYFPNLYHELDLHFHAAQLLIEQALFQASPLFRLEVDYASTALSLFGLLFTTISWQYQGWLVRTDEEIKCTLSEAVRLLL